MQLHLQNRIESSAQSCAQCKCPTSSGIITCDINTHSGASVSSMGRSPSSSSSTYSFQSSAKYTSYQQSVEGGASVINNQWRAGHQLSTISGGWGIRHQHSVEGGTTVINIQGRVGLQLTPFSGGWGISNHRSALMT